MVRVLARAPCYYKEPRSTDIVIRGCNKRILCAVTLKYTDPTSWGCRRAEQNSAGFRGRRALGRARTSLETRGSSDKRGERNKEWGNKDQEQRQEKTRDKRTQEIDKRQEKTREDKRRQEIREDKRQQRGGTKEVERQERMTKPTKDRSSNRKERGRRHETTRHETTRNRT